MNERLKKLIFRKLYEDLSQVEIIHYDESIWFIDRKKKYWYFEYDKSGILYWRYRFFSEFFKIFSLDKVDEYQPIICEWVEEVLNCKVYTPKLKCWRLVEMVEEVLNCKVHTPCLFCINHSNRVEEVLNCKVHTPSQWWNSNTNQVEEVLNYKVNTPLKQILFLDEKVEEVLKCKVHTAHSGSILEDVMVEEILNKITI